MFLSGVAVIVRQFLPSAILSSPPEEIGTRFFFGELAGVFSNGWIDRDVVVYALKGEAYRIRHVCFLGGYVPILCGISKLTTHTAHTGAHHAHRRTPRTPRTPAHTTHTEVIGGPKYVYTYERLARRFRSAGVATYMLAVSTCTSCIIVINYVKVIYTKCGPFSYPRNCGYILLHSAVTSSVSLSDALSKL